MKIQYDFNEERMLAQKYKLSVQMKEDLHIQDQKYWDYYGHVMTLRKADGTLFDLVSKIHEERRENE